MVIRDHRRHFEVDESGDGIRFIILSRGMKAPLTKSETSAQMFAEANFGLQALQTRGFHRLYFFYSTGLSSLDLIDKEGHPRLSFRRRWKKASKGSTL